jgi:hypothetical protein
MYVFDVNSVSINDARTAWVVMLGTVHLLKVVNGHVVVCA